MDLTERGLSWLMVKKMRTVMRRTTTMMKRKNSQMWKREQSWFIAVPPKRRMSLNTFHPFCTKVTIIDEIVVASSRKLNDSWAMKNSLTLAL